MKVLNTSHAAFNISDEDRSLRFYIDCLGLKKKFVLTRKAQFEAMKNAYLAHVPSLDMLPEKLRSELDDMERHQEDTWLIYIEVAPHQYLELFPVDPTWEHHQPAHETGYQHLALEVDDIHAAYDKMVACGVKTLTKPSLGVEATWQFWLEDPDGNRIELMQYTENSLQLIGNV